MNWFKVRDDIAPEGGELYQKIVGPKYPGWAKVARYGMASGFPLCCVVYFTAVEDRFGKRLVKQPYYGPGFVCCPWHARRYSQPETQQAILDHTIASADGSMSDDWTAVPNFKG